MAEKTEKKSGGGQIIKLALVLFAVSAIMALALGLVNELTKDTIAMRAAETTKKAYANVLAADEYTEQADFENDGTITKLSTATTGGQQVYLRRRDHVLRRAGHDHHGRRPGR